MRPPQGGDHGLAAADAVTGQDLFSRCDSGELVQPAGHAGGERCGCGCRKPAGTHASPWRHPRLPLARSCPSQIENTHLLSCSTAAFFVLRIDPTPPSRHSEPVPEQKVVRGGSSGPRCLAGSGWRIPRQLVVRTLSVHVRDFTRLDPERTDI
jgi:hypothetical protein